MIKMTKCGCMYNQQSAKYEFASSNTTRTTFAFDACFVWKLAPLADDAIEHVLNVANSYLAYRTSETANIELHV
jgi:hypothetical protein